MKMKRTTWGKREQTQLSADSLTLDEEATRSRDRPLPSALAVVAHELCGVTVPLRLQLDLLRSGHLGRLESGQVRALKVAERSLDRLDLILHDLTDLSRINGLGIRLDREVTDLTGLVREVHETFAGLAERDDIALEYDLDGPVWLHVDPGRLIQVLTNLVSNAIKFTYAGGRITLTLRRASGPVEIVVRDTGRGMARDRIDELFRPFSQLHDPQDGPQGTGLGLYISQQIIRGHGGEILASSEGPGRGSTFTVCLPLGPRERADKDPEVAARWNRCG